MEKTKTAYLFCFLILFISCEHSLKDKTKLGKHSAEELFRGLVLMEGVLTQSIPSYAHVYNFHDHSTKKVSEERSKMNDYILSYINTLSPDYLQSFKEKLDTKNPYVIEEALKESGLTVLEAIQNHPVYSKYAIYANKINENVKSSAYDLNTEEGREAYKSAVKTFVATQPDSEPQIIGFVMVVAVALVAVVAAVAFWVVPSIQDSDNLSSEFVVQEIIEHY